MKQISFPTNLNNKLACPKFLHIDAAPERGIAEKELQETIIEISTKDGSHAPVQTKLVDLCRLPIYQLTDICTFQSHGMTANEFVRWYARNHKTATVVDVVAIYYYEKI